VNVIAGIYTSTWLRNPGKDESPDLSLETWVHLRGLPDALRIFVTELVLLVHFVPRDVEEEVVQIWAGPSLDDFQLVSLFDAGDFIFKPLIWREDGK
jgi:hypothetical protein